MGKTVQWYLNSNDDPCAITSDQSGNVYVTGSSSDDTATIAYDSNGNELWIALFDEDPSIENINEPIDITIDSFGNLYVTGRSITLSG